MEERNAHTPLHDMFAHHVLQHHNLTPSDLLYQLKTRHEQTPFVLEDDQGDVWFFILRRRGRLFLMAKTSTMTAYADVYSVSGYE